MLSKAEAERRVSDYLDDLKVDGGVAILSHATLDRPYGWVFFYNAKRYLETGDPLEALGGNSPILVEADSGELTLLGTAEPVEDALQRFEDARGLRGA
jgi:hypothetical protein